MYNINLITTTITVSSLDFWNGTMHMDIVNVVDDDDDATKYDPYDTKYDTNP